MSTEAVDVDALRRYPHFDRLPANILAKLVPHVGLETDPAGTRILRRGDYSDAAFFIAAGTVQVHVPRAVETAAGPGPKTGAAGQPGTYPFEVIRLAAGEIFGEIGALSRFPTNADVIADTDVTLLRIGTPALRLMRKQTALADFTAFIDNRYRARSLASHLKENPLLQGVSDEAIEALRTEAELLSFDPGDTIIEQGASDESLYFVRGGLVRVSIAAGAANGKPAAVTILRRGDYAGELSLLARSPWPYALAALEHVEVIRLSRADLDPLLGDDSPVVDRLRRAAAARQAELDRLTRHPAAAEPLEMAIDQGIINGQSVLVIDMTTCTGCDDCVRACADTHDGRALFGRQGPRFQQWSIPQACYQCSDPVCMIGCPTGAITRPDGGIAVAIDRQTCIGCGNCVSRCPWQNIVAVPVDAGAPGKTVALATKCDLCHGRAAGPACVQMCPQGSATRISFSDSAAVARLFALAPASSEVR